MCVRYAHALHPASTQQQTALARSLAVCTAAELGRASQDWIYMGAALESFASSKILHAGGGAWACVRVDVPGAAGRVGV